MFKIKKINIYIALTIICIIFTVLIQSTSKTTSQPPNQIDFKLDQEKILSGSKSHIFLFSTFSYLFIMLIGLANLVSLSLKKIKKLPLTDLKIKIKNIHLSSEKISKILFIISLFVLALYLTPSLIYFLLHKKISVSFFLILNLALQVGTSIIIIKSVGSNFLGFLINKKQLIFTLKIYSATLPILFISLLLNIFIAQKFNLHQSLNPAIKIFLTLDNKISIFLLAAQIAIIGPIAEEILFRGFLYKVIRSRKSFIFSSVFISLFFSLIHRVPYNILPLFVISLAFCYVYEKTQNVSAPILLHSIHNCISLSFLLILKNLV